LVLGGSQGAKEINDLIAECLPELTQYFFIVHQTGAQPPSPKKTNAQLQKNYSAVPYIKNEMPDVLAAASLVVGRSGAGTVWEAATVGRPMLLIPLCGSGTRGDQVENAKYFAERGAACMLLHPTAAQLVEAISQLASNENRLEEMANQSKKIGEKNAARMIIDYG
jgi:UDP-N-acetylglucosamine--N-acetylmuramyl-(pentapeptide) pyrophosphoryl-undecaprenol N-acetylglucosamine transferase